MWQCVVCGKPLESEDSLERKTCLRCLKTEVVTNSKGAKQSYVPYRMDLLPPLAILAIARVLEVGARKYGENNWHGIPVEDHINHALTHLMLLAAEDKTESHLENAATRLLFALDQILSGRNPKV